VRSAEERGFEFVTGCGSDGSIVFGIVDEFFFSVNTITYEPLHLAWQNFARTCTSPTSKGLLNIKAKGQGHMVLLCVFCVHDIAYTSWPGFTKCCTGIARGQYWALSKGWHSCFWTVQWSVNFPKRPVTRNSRPLVQLCGNCRRPHRIVEVYRLPVVDGIWRLLWAAKRR